MNSKIKLTALFAVIVAGLVAAQVIVMNQGEIQTADIVLEDEDLGAFVLNMGTAVLDDNNIMFSQSTPIMSGYVVLSTMQDPYYQAWTWQRDHNTVNGFVTKEYTRNSDYTLITEIDSGTVEVIGVPGTYFVMYSTINPCDSALLTCE